MPAHHTRIWQPKVKTSQPATNHLANMSETKLSFLSKLIGKNTYATLKRYAKIIVAVGTCILVVLFILSLFVHASFLSRFIDIVTGTSILFAVYIASLVILLDIEVVVDEAFASDGSKKNKLKSSSYRWSTIWFVFLLLFAVAAVYFSNEYRRHYAFECTTYKVDVYSKIYHLSVNNHCPIAAESNNLVKMKGYEIDNSIGLCDFCQQWAKDAEFHASDGAMSHNKR